MTEENTLFPVYEVPELESYEEIVEEKYRKSIKWDMERGDFVRDGAYRIVESSGRDTYMQWCHKMICTERYVHLAYPDSLGVELEEAMSQLTSNEVESCLERTISEALLVNPRTEYVRDFSFDWAGDTVHCEFTVKGKEWDEFKIERNIQLGGGEE